MPCRQCRLVRDNFKNLNATTHGMARMASRYVDWKDISDVIYSGTMEYNRRDHQVVIRSPSIKVVVNVGSMAIITVMRYGHNVYRNASARKLSKNNGPQLPLFLKEVQEHEIRGVWIGRGCLRVVQ
jgi:hypothetical protein